MTVVVARQALPHWDLSVIYPAIQSPEFERGFDDTFRRVDSFVTEFERVVASFDTNHELSNSSIQDFESIIAQYNSVLAEIETLDAYLFGHVSVDSRDDLAQAKASEFERRSLRPPKTETAVCRVDRPAGPRRLFARSAVAREHEFLLKRSKISSHHLMSQLEEELAAELHLSGGGAWSKLHSNLTSQILVPLSKNGTVERLPMSAIRNLADNEERGVRKRAYEAEMTAWEEHSVPLAAALNGIKGESITVNSRRNWSDSVDLAVFQNHIDRSTLEAISVPPKRRSQTSGAIYAPKAGCSGRMDWPGTTCSLRLFREPRCGRTTNPPPLSNITSVGSHRVCEFSRREPSARTGSMPNRALERWTAPFVCRCAATNLGYCKTTHRRSPA